jgi:transposase
VELQGYAGLLEGRLTIFETRLEGMKEKAAERVKSDSPAPHILSIPETGIETAGALPACLGDGSRFGGTGQAAGYAGLTPRADCSVETERYGGIAGNQFYRPIRGVVLEGVWAMAGSGTGPLFKKYGELTGRMGKKKSAAARKMAGLAWLLMKRWEYYCGMSNEALAKKLRYYKIKKLVEEEVSA